jgi:hypothetical protein
MTAWHKHNPKLKAVRMFNDYGGDEAWRVCRYKMQAHEPGPGHDFWVDALLEVGRIMEEEDEGLGA